MKKRKQLSFGFMKEQRDKSKLENHLRRCRWLSGYLLMAQLIVSVGRIWILTN